MELGDYIWAAKRDKQVLGQLLCFMEGMASGLVGNV